MSDQEESQEPVAYAIWHVSERYPSRTAYSVAFKMMRGTGEVHDGKEHIPLYGKPTLTDEEREAVARSIDECVATAGLANDRATIDAADRAAATLRSLLQRLGGTSE